MWTTIAILAFILIVVAIIILEYSIQSSKIKQGVHFLAEILLLVSSFTFGLSILHIKSEIRFNIERYKITTEINKEYLNDTLIKCSTFYVVTKK